MSGVVRELPGDVIDRIAAGEVVERPASVLKELMENAVDAEARRVEVLVGGTFPYTITVADDGCGMAPDDLERAVRRHTTSKIAGIEDLERLATFGFRGEALPSIGAVARLRIATRPAGSGAGWEIVLENGIVREFREVGTRPGTVVTVSELFAAVPARRKFLKSPRTETARLWEVFHAVAIPCEGVAFRMEQGRAEFSYEAKETALERAARHAGEQAPYLVPVEAVSPFFRLSGLAGLPQAARASGAGVHVFLNGRHVRDRGLFAAVREVYRGILPEGRLPLLYLFIRCDPAEADVNVHPAKAEVRFRYGRELFELVRHAVGEALGRPAGRSAAGAGMEMTRAGAVREGPALGTAQLAWRLPDGPGAPAGPPEECPEGSPEGGRGRRFAALRPVGQLLGTYIVCEGPGEVVIIDQHAAHERILFSRLKDLYLGGAAPLQHWLVPQEVEVPPWDESERAAAAEFMRRAGLLVETGPGAVWRITGGPALLGAFDAAAWWREVVAFWEEHGPGSAGSLDADRALWSMACRAAVRAGDPLSPEAMRRLLEDLDGAVDRHSCPHGRPVWVRLGRSELAGMFGRS